MAFYSMVVWTPVEVEVREKLLLLDPGTNTFNIQTDDVDTFVARLTAHGARIIEMHRLDGLEAIPVDPEFGLPEVPILPTGGDT